MGIGFVLLVVVLSLVRPPRDVDITSAANAGHVIAYFWLMIWFAQLHRALGHRLLLAIAFCALGAVLEVLQGITGYRSFDYYDMANNALGVGLGLALARTRLQYALVAVERRMPR